jgi:hypothetical protein
MNDKPDALEDLSPALRSITAEVASVLVPTAFCNVSSMYSILPPKAEGKWGGRIGGAGIVSRLTSQPAIAMLTDTCRVSNSPATI